MNKLFVFALGLIFVSCSSKYRPTPFQFAVKDFGLGLTIKSNPKTEDFYTSTFLANSSTSMIFSENVSKLGAYYHCGKKGKLPVIIKTLNLSKTENRTTINSSPGYYVNGRYVPGYTYSNNYKVNYPGFMSPFVCATRIRYMKDKYIYKDIGPELVNKYTGDFRGGLLVSANNKKSPLKNDDIIIKVNGKRIDSELEMSYTSDNFTKKKKVELSILRNKKKIKVRIPLQDTTSSYTKKVQKYLDNQCGFNVKKKIISMINQKNKKDEKTKKEKPKLKKKDKKKNFYGKLACNDTFLKGLAKGEFFKLIKQIDAVKKKKAKNWKAI